MPCRANEGDTRNTSGSFIFIGRRPAAPICTFMVSARKRNMTRRGQEETLGVDRKTLAHSRCDRLLCLLTDSRVNEERSQPRPRGRRRGLHPLRLPSFLIRRRRAQSRPGERRRGLHLPRLSRSPGRRRRTPSAHSVAPYHECGGKCFKLLARGIACEVDAHTHTHRLRRPRTTDSRRSAIDSPTQ
jgi:hypothetical protein